MNNGNEVLSDAHTSVRECNSCDNNDKYAIVLQRIHCSSVCVAWPGTQCIAFQCSSQKSQEVWYQKSHDICSVVSQAAERGKVGWYMLHAHAQREAALDLTILAKVGTALCRLIIKICKTKGSVCSVHNIFSYSTDAVSVILGTAKEPLHIYDLVWPSHDMGSLKVLKTWWG